MSKEKLQEKKTGMNYLMIVVYVFFCSFAVNAHAEGCGGAVSYEGKGAGQVLFDRKLHVSKGLTCNDCHEGKAFSFPLFEMKKGANMLSMRSMELGKSCGSCHDGKKAFSTTSRLNCSKCHLK
jgi:c(7)-type cytochrome triheme protein